MIAFLKITAAALGVVVIAAIGASYVAVHRAQQTPEALAAVQAEVIASDARDVVQKRIDILARDGCQGQTTALLALDAARPVTSIADLSDQLAGDLKLCLDRGIIYAYLKGSLEDAGLLHIFK